MQMLTRWIYLTGAVIVVATISFMFLALFINVVLRYAFESGITWAYEIHNILLPWLVAGGAVMASAKGANIAVMVVVDALPEIGRRFVAIAVHAFVAVLCIVVAKSSIPIMKAGQFSRLAETGIPQSYGYASLLYAFSAIAIIALFFTIRLLLGEKADVSDPTASSFS